MMPADIIKGETPGEGEKMNASNVYCFPNPSSGKTTLRFTIAEPETVRIDIYDIDMDLVWHRDLNAAEVRAGANYIEWNGQNGTDVDAANGVYLFRIQTGEKIIIKKIVIIK